MFNESGHASSAASVLIFLCQWSMTVGHHAIYVQTLEAKLIHKGGPLWTHFTRAFWLHPGWFVWLKTIIISGWFNCSLHPIQCPFLGVLARRYFLGAFLLSFPSNCIQNRQIISRNLHLWLGCPMRKEHYAGPRASAYIVGLLDCHAPPSVEILLSGELWELGGGVITISAVHADHHRYEALSFGKSLNSHWGGGGHKHCTKKENIWIYVDTIGDS